MFSSSLAKEQESLGLSEYEKEVLNTRLASLENNPDTFMSWNEIRSRISV